MLRAFAVALHAVRSLDGVGVGGGGFAGARPEGREGPMVSVIGDDAASVLATHLLALSRGRPRLITASAAAARAAEQLGLRCRAPGEVGRRHDQRACVVLDANAESLVLAAEMIEARGVVVLCPPARLGPGLAQDVGALPGVALAALVEREAVVVARSRAARLPMVEAALLARGFDAAVLSGLLAPARAA